MAKPVLTTVRQVKIPEAVATTEMAALLDMTGQNLSILAAQGTVPKVSPGIYCPRDVVHAYVKHLKMNPTGARFSAKSVAGQMALTDQRNRLYKVKADHAEVDLEEKRLKLVRAEDAQSFWASVCSLAKVRLLSIPKKLAAQLALINSPTKIETMLSGEINLALTELSASSALPDSVGSTEVEEDLGEGDAELAAAARPDRERVGRRQPQAQRGS